MSRLAVDLYLVIPWILGIAAWLIARRRGMRYPIGWGIAAFFILGFPIVLLFDFGVLG
jgi:hypothetical protein